MFGCVQLNSKVDTPSLFYEGVKTNKQTSFPNKEIWPKKCCDIQPKLALDSLNQLHIFVVFLVRNLVK
jgi:hypothetical protein